MHVWNSRELLKIACLDLSLTHYQILFSIPFFEQLTDFALHDNYFNKVLIFYF